jgi:hypothetical protein
MLVRPVKEADGSVRLVSGSKIVPQPPTEEQRETVSVAVDAVKARLKSPGDQDGPDTDDDNLDQRKTRAS